MLIYILIAFTTLFVIYKWFTAKKEDTDLLSQFFADKNWLNSGKPSHGQDIRSFKIEISKDDIEYFSHRLELSRFPVPSHSTTRFHYGMRDDFMRKLTEYWKNEYSWRKQEEMLNTFKHFKTNIEGLDIHFIHETPRNIGQGIDCPAIIVMHGWPGSFVEYLDVIKMLTDPKQFGGNETDAFSVVCPSIPGFGFSDAPQKEGFNAYECARIYHKLMLRLHYKKYYVAGGDWGSLLSNAMALLYPSYVKGCYTTMSATSPSGANLLQTFLSSYLPSVFVKQEEINKIFPLKNMFKDMLLETGYFHLQATKPDTVGFALSDSPVGLAAYIIEKFSTWTDINARNSIDGMLCKHWTMDQLLNNVMIYWWAGNITSSMRFYKENMNTKLRPLANVKVRVPSGYGWFPGEFIPTCKSWVKRKYANLVHFTYMKHGGHFNAYQHPDLFADDIRLFVRKVKEVEREVLVGESYEAGDIKASHMDRYNVNEDVD